MLSVPLHWETRGSLTTTLHLPYGYDAFRHIITERSYPEFDDNRFIRSLFPIIRPVSPSLSYVRVAGTGPGPPHRNFNHCRSGRWVERFANWQIVNCSVAPATGPVTTYLSFLFLNHLLTVYATLCTPVMW